MQGAVWRVGRRAPITTEGSQRLCCTGSGSPVRHRARSATRNDRWRRHTATEGSRGSAAPEGEPRPTLNKQRDATDGGTLTASEGSLRHCCTGRESPPCGWIWGAFIFNYFFIYLIFFKRLATNLATFGKTSATFQMWPVLSCEHEILSYTSPCVCSDRWVLAPAERSSTFQWPHGSWHRCQWAAHVHTVLPRTNHLPASPLFEIKLFNLTVFSSCLFFFFFFLFFSCTYITHCHRALVHSSFWTPLRSLTGLCLRDCTWLYLLVHNNKLN